MTRKDGAENRRSPRVAISKGIWVAWHASGPRHVSRVRDLSAGGVFVSTATPVSIGTTVNLLFSLPEGEVRAQGVVRYRSNGKGMGVEFTKIDPADRTRLEELLNRLSS